MKQIFEHKKFSYYGYIFCSNGEVYNSHGKKLKPHYKNGVKHVFIHIPKEKSNHTRGYKRKSLPLAKTIYELYHNEKLERNEYLAYKDNNPDNCDIQNLYKMKKTNIKSLSPEQINEIKNLYINQDKHITNSYNKDSLSIRELAQKYNVSTHVIQKVIHKLKIMVPLIIIRDNDIEYIAGTYTKDSLYIDEKTGGIHYKSSDSNKTTEKYGSETASVNFTASSENDSDIQFVPMELYQHLVITLDSTCKKGTIMKEIEKWRKK